MQGVIAEKMEEAIAVFEAVKADQNLLNTLAASAEKTASVLRAGGKLMIAGNGGSAADAQHLAAEFVCRLTVDRPALRAMALTTDSSCLTAIGNDYSYDDVFARQIEALGQKGDIFLGISTSGNSKNILKALTLSHAMGITTIGLSGHDGGKVASHCDYSIVIPSAVTAHIQESHLALEHIFCHLVELSCFGAERFSTRI